MTLLRKDTATSRKMKSWLFGKEKRENYFNSSVFIQVDPDWFNLIIIDPICWPKYIIYQWLLSKKSIIQKTILFCATVFNGINCHEIRHFSNLFNWYKTLNWFYCNYKIQSAYLHSMVPNQSFQRGEINYRII